MEGRLLCTIGIIKYCMSEGDQIHEWIDREDMEELGYSHLAGTGWPSGGKGTAQAHAAIIRWQMTEKGRTGLLFRQTQLCQRWSWDWRIGQGYKCECFYAMSLLELAFESVGCDRTQTTQNTLHRPGQVTRFAPQENAAALAVKWQQLSQMGGDSRGAQKSFSNHK
jgi:hypothetical protein